MLFHNLTHATTSYANSNPQQMWATLTLTLLEIRAELTCLPLLHFSPRFQQIFIGQRYPGWHRIHDLLFFKVKCRCIFLHTRGFFNLTREQWMLNQFIFREESLIGTLISLLGNKRFVNSVITIWLNVL
jgi:hypothetical protein